MVPPSISGRVRGHLLEQQIGESVRGIVGNRVRDQVAGAELLHGYRIAESLILYCPPLRTNWKLLRSVEVWPLLNT